MTLITRLFLSLLVAFAYSAALVMLLTATTLILPLLVGSMIISAVALAGLFWVWKDYPYKDDK